jgi:CheY-like chemotaxis protein
MTHTVLVVEDAELCRETLEVALLKVPNLAVCSVTSAEEALQWLSSRKASALVTDLRLPRMDGYELIESIRSQPGCSSLPILVISGDSDPRVRSRVASLGADAYFSKPYSPAAVRHKLAELISGRNNS